MFRCNNLSNVVAVAIIVMVALPITCAAGLKPGDKLPDLAGFHLEGKLPDDLKGKVILLDFWASWCPPCKASFPAMEELKTKYAGEGLTIIAVSVDEKRENMERFLSETKISFATLRDAEQKLVAVVDVPTMPTSYLIDRSGAVRYVHVGFQSGQTPKDYAKEIEQLLKEGKP
jgi:thiol-disulfide isomerase/thioredoxin